MKLLIIISILLFFSCGSNQIQKEQLKSVLQGKWVLYQNPSSTLEVIKDTIIYYEYDIISNKEVYHIKNKINAKHTIGKDTIIGDNDALILETYSMEKHLVIHQYGVLSFSQNKIVLTPIYSGQLLTFDRIIDEK